MDDGSGERKKSQKMKKKAQIQGRMKWDKICAVNVK